MFISSFASPVVVGMPSSFGLTAWHWRNVRNASRNVTVTPWDAPSPAVTPGIAGKPTTTPALTGPLPRAPTTRPATPNRARAHRRERPAPRASPARFPALARTVAIHRQRESAARTNWTFCCALKSSKDAWPGPGPTVAPQNCPASTVFAECQRGKTKGTPGRLSKARNRGQPTRTTPTADAAPGQIPEAISAAACCCACLRRSGWFSGAVASPLTFPGKAIILRSDGGGFGPYG